MKEGINKLKKLQSEKELTDQLLSYIPFTLKELEQNGLYIFGAAKLGIRMLAFFKSVNIKVHNIIDNNPKLIGTTIEGGLNIVSLDSVKKNSIIFIATMNYYTEIEQQLIQNGYHNFFSQLQANVLFNEDKTFPKEMYSHGITEDIFNNKDKYLWLYEMMADEKSKETLDQLIEFRLTYNFKHILNVCLPYELHYFDADIISKTSNEVFYDIGAFDGDSTEKCLEYFNNTCKSIHLFEPDGNLLEKAKEKLKNHKNIIYNQLGVFDKDTVLYFNATGDLGGSFANNDFQKNDETIIKINTVAIDNYLHSDKPTYIKMDIEGVEPEAIYGGRQIIKDYKPKLAISAYHMPSHLWSLAHQILAIQPNYKLYLRHYTKNVFESVMYFIPA